MVFAPPRVASAGNPYHSATGNAVTPEVVRFQMGGRDRQHVAFPEVCRKSLPRILLVIRRVGPPIHPYKALSAPCRHVSMECHEVLGARIDLAPDSKTSQAAHPVVGGVGPALVLGHDGNTVRIVAVGAHP